MLNRFVLVKRRLLKFISIAPAQDNLARFSTNTKMDNINDIPKSSHRGALIVFEGVDRSGKTTQCNMLQKNLNADGGEVQLMKFPG